MSDTMVNLDYKVCITCGRRKVTDVDFYKRKRRDGTLVPRGECKVCGNARSLRVQQSNPERSRAYGRTAKAKMTRRARTLRDKYGMTEEEWDGILEDQGGTCAICDGRSGDPSLHGDHNHATGVFRAILCGLCNRMLGQGQDDPERLLAGARYLQERGC